MTLIILSLFIVVPLGWIALKLAPWSAPITGLIGLVVGWAGCTAHSDNTSLFGGGLFLFSAILFVLGGGMRGR